MVCKLVGFFILFAADVADGKAGDERDPALSIIVERADSFIPNLVFAVDLLHNQLRVGKNVEFVAFREHRKTQCREKRGIFRVIIRSGRSEIFGDPDNAWKENPDTGLTRISS